VKKESKTHTTTLKSDQLIGCIASRFFDQF
jgi:hypothetical protein